jgi:predicted nucleic acid-binding protein
MGVGAHTKYTSNALFTSALMLQKGGKAYIQTNMWNYLVKNSYDAKKTKLLIKSVFNRLVVSYNKILEKSNLNKRKYSFNFIESNNLGFVEIERIK